MEVWNGKEWIVMDDFTGSEWDGFENFESLVEEESDYIDLQADLDEVVDRMMCDPRFYDTMVGGF